MKPRLNDPLLQAAQVWPCIIAFGFTLGPPFELNASKRSDE